MKNKRSIILILILLVITIFSLTLININVYASVNDCEKITDDIEYFTVSLFDYNNIKFNEKARNMTQSQFNSLSIQERNDIDKKHTLFGNAGMMWDKWHGVNASMYGGLQNGTILQNGEATAYTYDASILKGIVQNKLINNNIVLTHQNNNDMVLFPTIQQAENKGLVGDNQPYQEIIRDCKIPFLKSSSGYYYMDSSKYHFKKTNNQNLELHKRRSRRTFRME